MTLQQNITHAVIALAAIAAVSCLAAYNVLTGSDAYTVIIAVLVGSGVIAGVNLGTGSTPTPTPTPQAPPAATVAQQL